MDNQVVQRMVQAREAAMNVHLAFPGGDRRFVDAEDDDDEVEDDVETSLLKNEDEEEEALVEEECIGLFDDITDRSPHHCLRRAFTDYDIDLVSLMDGAQLDILDRIRVVNWIRTLIRIDELRPTDVINRVKNLLLLKDGDLHVFDSDKYLTPIIEGDVLLTVLESSADEGDGADETNGLNRVNPLAADDDSGKERDTVHEALTKTFKKLTA